MLKHKKSKVLKTNSENARKAELKKFQQMEQEKNRKTVANRQINCDLVDKLREDIMQDLEVDIKFARSVKGKMDEAKSGHLRAKSQADLFNALSKKNVLDVNLEDNHLKIR